ncbi:MAG: lipopolysaccharide biosynthesis protein [Dysgonomonas sp.]
MKILNYVKTKLNKTDERSSKIGKNIIGTFIFKGGSMLVNLMLVPLTIKFVSASEYGIWLTLSSIIAWFGISDIGFGHGLRNKFAEAVALGDKKLARSYVSTAYGSVAVLMLILWFLFFIINQFLDWSIILNADRSMKEELSKVVLIVITFFVLQFIFKLVGTVLTANQEPAKASGFDFIANFFVLGSIYLLMYLNINGSLEILAIFTGFYQLIVFVLASLWFYSHELKEYKPSIKYFEKEKIRSLMGLGIKFFIIQMAAIFVFQSTNIIIAQILGPEQVTVYNIAFRYFTIPTTIAAIILSPFWSAITDAYVKKDYIWMRKINKQINHFMILISLVLIVALFVAEPIYKLWIGDNVKIPKQISMAMMINLLATNYFNMKVIIINGIGKIKLQLIIYAVLSIIFIPITVILGKFFGLTGIIYSNFMVYLLFAILLDIQSRKILKITAKGVWDE